MSQDIDVSQVPVAAPGVAPTLVEELIQAGVHFGHRCSRWNPKMAPYIYARKGVIHIIDVRETVRGLLRAKTGTLFDTIGLSGLAVGKDGRLKAFSYLVNSRPQKVSPLTTRRNVDKLAATVTGCY